MFTLGPNSALLRCLASRHSCSFGLCLCCTENRTRASTHGSCTLSSTQARNCSPARLSSSFSIFLSLSLCLFCLFSLLSPFRQFCWAAFEYISSSSIINLCSLAKQINIIWLYTYTKSGCLRDRPCHMAWICRAHKNAHSDSKGAKNTASLPDIFVRNDYHTHGLHRRQLLRPMVVSPGAKLCFFPYKKAALCIKTIRHRKNIKAAPKHNYYDGEIGILDHAANAEHRCSRQFAAAPR